MKNVQMLDLGNGKTYEIEFINSPMTNSNRIMIELESSGKVSEIAADFEGCQTIKKTDSIKPGRVELYEGFSKLVSIQRNKAAGTVRITLEKGDVA